MSQVVQQGWWQASDGNWYPPETHPSIKVAYPQQSMQPVKITPWAANPYERDNINFSTEIVSHKASLVKQQTKRDTRGLVAALGAAALVGATYVPFYKNSASSQKKIFVTTSNFGTWRKEILIVAGVVIILGLVNTLFRSSMRGAVAVLTVLRIACLGELGVWIYALIDRTVTKDNIHTKFTVTPYAYGACAIALFVFFVTLSVRKPTLTG